MRPWTLVLAVLSSLGAPAPSVGGPRERTRGERAFGARGAEFMGVRVEGERFLVWDENPEEAAAWGSELARVDAKAADSRWPVLCAWCGSRCNEAPVEGSSSICPDCLARHFEEDPGTS